MKLSGQGTLLNQIVSNTANTVQAQNKTNQLNEKLATDMVNKWSSKTGSFSNLQTEITKANTDKENASNMKTEDNYWVSYYTQWKKSVEDEIKNTEDKDRKEALEKQKDYLEEQLSASKDAAEKEIQTAKDTAEKEVKVAEEKKEKLTKLAEATTNAIKAQLEKEKAAAEKTVNDQLTKLESNYNKKIAALEEESTDTSRKDTKQEYKNSIAVLKTKMNNTASYADRQALALQIKDKQKELSKQEKEWNTEDKKAALEKEYNKQKKTLEKQLKDVDSYYSKLEETDSLNAQARYTLLNTNQQELVALLNKYNPQWQNAGQSLADSLLTGLNSQKQSIQDAVSEMVSLRDSANSTSSNQYYDAATQTYKGYASGTNYNHLEDLYLTNEKGFELNTAGDVAYVSQGAGIKNHMESLKYIDSEIGRQVALMKNSILSEQYKLANLVTGAVSSVTNNSKNIQYDGSNQFVIENLNLNTGQDVEQFFNEAETIRQKNKKC